MTRRSPARLLAPLALIVAALSILLVVNSERSSSDASPSSSTPTSSTSTSKAKRPKTATGSEGTASRSTSVPASTPSKSKARTYTVKPGDVPSSIAEQAGTTVDELLELNDITDPQSLSVGQKLKLP